MTRLETQWTRTMHVDLFEARVGLGGEHGLAPGDGLRSGLVTSLRAVAVALVSAVRRARDRYVEWRRAGELRIELRSLDDRTLRDLGFARDEIDSVLSELARAAPATRLRVIRN